MRHIAILLALATLTFGQTFEVKDRNGIPVVMVSEIKMFRYSSYFNKDIADFQCAVKNISGKDLKAVALRAIVHKKDGSKVEFSFNVNVCDVCDFRKDSILKATHEFLEGPYTPEEFDLVEFAVPESWQSPEDKRLAAEAQAKKEAADAARIKRLAAEQKKKDAELNAHIAKARAEEEARNAKERRKVRAACTIIYQDTADKKLKDLTVREEQQVRACQALGLYPPQ